MGIHFQRLEHLVVQPIALAGARHRGNHPSLGGKMGRRGAFDVGKHVESLETRADPACPSLDLPQRKLIANLMAWLAEFEHDL